MMKIFADSGTHEVLADLLAGMAEQNVSIVQMEQLQPNTTRQNVVGLDVALRVAREGAPVVMLGWMTPKMYIDRRPQEWFAAMGHPNVMFRRLPATQEDIQEAIEEAKASKRQPDPLAIALLNVDQSNAAVRVLQHDLLSAEKDAGRMSLWLDRARAVFGDLSPSALIALVSEAGKAGGQGVQGLLFGQVFPDVCVDVEGTLLGSDGQLRAEVLALAQEKAGDDPITVWTGGYVHDLTLKLRGAGVMYKIASKDAMKGATVRVVIDNQPEDTFRGTYNIGFDEYVQV